MEIQRILELARQRMSLGQTDGAIDALRQALAHDPDLAEAHAYLAICLVQRKRLHAAGQEAGMALALDPELEVAHYAMATVAMARRDFRLAEQHIQQLQEADPNHAPYYLLYAELKALMQRSAEVLPLLQKALELDPESTRVLAQLSDYHLNRGELQQAEAFAHEALRQEPESVAALVAMGGVLLRRGNAADAREHAVWALRQEPDHEGALVLLSGVKARTSPLLGLWWRYNTWMNSVGSGRSILILLFAYLLFRVATMGLHDLGRPELATAVRYLWLAIVIYTFVGPALFMKALRRELATVKLREGF